MPTVGNRIMKKFSIITVCFNCENVIRDTIVSILNQTSTDYEYLIQDGASNDRTVKVAESFISAFAEKGIPYRIISQKDGGIYDAMNKAIQEAHGEWFLFMNAGDILADNDVLKTVKESGKLEIADIVYGDTIDKNRDWYIYNRAASLDTIDESMPFCHQSVFAKGKLHKATPYSTEYVINSDYLFYYQQYQEGKTFAYIPKPFSVFDRGGGISSNAVLSAQERLKIQEERPVRNEVLIQKRRNLLKRYKRVEFIYHHFYRYLPEKIRLKRRDAIREKQGWKHKEAFFEEYMKKQEKE